MNTYRLTDGPALRLPEPVESDRAEGCGVMRGALFGVLVWAALFAIVLAF